MKRILFSIFLLIAATSQWVYAVTPVNPLVRISTNMGDIDLELFQAEAPKTVENFLHYVKTKHYKNTIFHRVINGFMIQGGGYTSNFQEKPTAKNIMSEAENGLQNTAGTLAMERRMSPDSAAAQFYINLVDNPSLDFRSKNSPREWGYTVFGKVVAGLDVVKNIAKVPTTHTRGMDDVPTWPIIIKNVSLLSAEKLKKRQSVNAQSNP